MTNAQMADKLEFIAGDVMWTNHCEINKETLKEAAKLLRMSAYVWSVSWKQIDSLTGAQMPCRVVYRDSKDAEARVSALKENDTINREIKMTGSVLN